MVAIESLISDLDLREAMGELSDADCRVVLLRLEGYTQTEIAKQIGISQPAVYKRLKKIYALLREKIT